MEGSDVQSNSFARNSVFGTVAGLASAIGGFLASVVLARTLGVEGSGSVAFALWVAASVALVADLGANASLTRYLPELTAVGKIKQAWRLAAFLFKPPALCCGVAFAAFGLYASWTWLNEGSQSAVTPVLWLLTGCLCVLQVLGGLTMGFLRGMQRFDRAALVIIISVIINITAVSIGALIFGSIGALGGFCVGSIIPASIALPFVYRDSNIPPALRERVVRYARYAWAAGLASSFVWARVEVFFLQRSGGSEQVGLFTAALTFSNLAVQAPMLLTGGLLPYFSENFGRNAHENIRAGYSTGTRIMGFLAFPACFGLAAITPAAFPLLFGQAFVAAVPATVVLVIASSFGVVAAVGSNLVWGVDRSDFMFLAGGTGAVLSIVAGLTLIPMFGVMGAAYARALIQIAMVGLGMWFIMRRLQCPAPLRELGQLMIAAATCAASAHVIVTLVPGTLGIFLAILGGALTYLVAVRLFCALPKSDVIRLHLLSQKLPKLLRGFSQSGLVLIFGHGGLPDIQKLSS
jgi:O-antigen/teichoic acid export membrane protein